MRQATSEECCRAFLEWTSRFGVPHVAISDNGNSFVANLYKDIMKTFNVEVKFTPAYHAATNGAIEKRHQTIKNSLKAALVDMGNVHQDKWISALPWVLLGKRVQVQPDLDISASQLVFGKAVSVPGQILGHPGAPLTNLQTRALLEELYKLSARPPVPTSAIVEPLDLSHTESAKHVYIKKEDPSGLSARFEGPYPIVSRPSRSTIQVRIGSYIDGSPRLQVYNWNLCKVAHLRDDAVPAERPRLGRKPNPGTPESPPSTSPSTTSPTSTTAESSKSSSPKASSSPHQETLSGKQPHPGYLQKGPLITDKMFDNADWPSILNIPKSSRPARSTRNPNPQYVDQISTPSITSPR